MHPTHQILLRVFSPGRSEFHLVASLHAKAGMEAAVFLEGPRDLLEVLLVPALLGVEVADQVPLLLVEALQLLPPR